MDGTPEEWAQVRDELFLALGNPDAMDLFEVCANIELFCIIGQSEFPDELFAILIDVLKSNEYRKHSGKSCVLHIFDFFFDRMTAIQQTAVKGLLEKLPPIPGESGSNLLRAELLAKQNKS